MAIKGYKQLIDNKKIEADRSLLGVAHPSAPSPDPWTNHADS